MSYPQAFGRQMFWNKAEFRCQEYMTISTDADLAAYNTFQFGTHLYTTCSRLTLNLAKSTGNSKTKQVHQLKHCHVNGLDNVAKLGKPVWSPVTLYAELS